MRIVIDVRASETRSIETQASLLTSKVGGLIFRGERGGVVHDGEKMLGSYRVEEFVGSRRIEEPR